MQKIKNRGRTFSSDKLIVNMKNKKYIIKIPDTVNVFYCEKKRILIVKGPLTQASLKLKTKIRLKANISQIEVTSLPLAQIPNSLKKKLKEKQGTAVALIKQIITNTSSTTYRKLNFVGVGYRAFPVDGFENRLLQLKLGYSHSIYFKIPENLKISCLKLTKLFIIGNSYQQTMYIASLIRSKKVPEPYKGKGIVYDNEKLKLKEGKKI